MFERFGQFDGSERFDIRAGLERLAQHLLPEDMPEFEPLAEQLCLACRAIWLYGPSPETEAKKWEAFKVINMIAWTKLHITLTDLCNTDLYEQFKNRIVYMVLRLI